MRLALLAWALLLVVLVGCSSSSEKKDIEAPADTVEQMDTNADVGLDTAEQPDQGAGEDLIEPEDTVEPEDLPELDTPQQEDTFVIPPEGLPLTIIHINDFHSHLMGMGPANEYTPDSIDDDDTLGGVARVATIVSQVREEVGDANFLAVDAGDFTMGTLFEFLSATEGVELQFLDLLGFHATVLGNHEYDWGPAGASAIVASGTSGTQIEVLASNIVTSDEDDSDDGFEALLTDGTVKRELLIDLPNGLTVGIFGLLGKGAEGNAPFMAPLTTRDLVEESVERVASLREQGADIVIALSHSGVVEGEAEDEDEILASSVPGLDVVVSGHSHTTLFEVEGDEDTVVVQAGSYGIWVGRLDLTVKPESVVVDGYELIPVDDNVPGDAAVQELVLTYIDAINMLVESQGLAYDSPIVETGFDLVQVKSEETALGNLLTDAMYFEINKVLEAAGEPPVVAVFEANGVIRDDILSGDQGLIQFSDAFRTLPLGIGPDGVPGYPMVRLWVSAQSLKFACESVLAMPMFAVLNGGEPDSLDEYYLQFSGLKFHYEPMGAPLPPNKITAIYLRDSDGYSDTPIDFDDEEILYPVAVNLYIASLMYSLEEMTMGMLLVTPLHEDGSIMTDFESAMIDIDPVIDGVQEAKTWALVAKYLVGLEDTDGNGIPNLPDSYNAPEGRMIPVD